MKAFLVTNHDPGLDYPFPVKVYRSRVKAEEYAYRKNHVLDGEGIMYVDDFFRVDKIEFGP